MVLLVGLIAQFFVLMPVAANAAVSSNSSTNIGNSSCDFVTGASQGFERQTSGSGTAENPFGLFTVDDFQELRYCVNSRANSLSGRVFALANDIDFTGATLIPIGDTNTGFSGKLFGRGKLLSGISIVTAGNLMYSGLFGRVDQTEMKDIRISGSVLGGGSAGLLIGYLRGGSIKNVIAYSSVSAAAALDQAQYKQIGGLIGVARAGASSNNSYCNEGDIVISNVSLEPLTPNSSVYGFGNSHGQTGAAGLVGQAMCTDIISARSSINVVFDGKGSVGGLLGLGTGKVRISNSVAFGNVTSNYTSSFTTGPNPSDFSNPNNYDNAGGIAGGLVGQVAHGISITDSHSFGDVSGVKGFIGGLVGAGTNIASENSGSNGQVSATDASWVGGFAGLLYALGSPAISKSYSSGNVFAPSTSQAAGFAAGVYGGYSITDSYVRGSISASATVANSRAAGFVAYANYVGPMQRNFVLNSVSTSALTNRGFVAKAQRGSGTQSANYWNNAVGLTDTSGWATALQPSSFSQSSSFAGFDIGSLNEFSSGSTWMMCDLAPVLRSSRFQADCPVFPRWSELREDGQQLLVFYGTPLSELGSITNHTVNSNSVTGALTLSDRVWAASSSGVLPGGVSVSLTLSQSNGNPLRAVKPTDQSIVDAASYSDLRVSNISMVEGPVISGAVPSRGYFNISNRVTISGGNLATSTVLVDGVAVTPVSNTATEIVLDVPSGAAGSSVSITVTNSLGSYVASNIFYRIPPPSISAIAPGSTSALGGASLEITGANFNGSTAVTVNGVAASFSLISDSKITFSSPAGAPGTTASVAVTTPAGTTTVDQGFFWNLLPVIDSLMPAAGALAGGETIVLAGARFTGTTALSFAGALVNTFTVSNDGEITFTAPVSASPGLASVIVTTANGSYSLPSAYTYLAAPTLQTNSPELATTNGGTIVTLTGTGLFSANQVYLGDATVSFTVLSDSRIRFTTPATSSGTVALGVRTAGGRATLSNAITFTSSSIAPQVTSISPSQGPAAGGTQVTLIGRHFSGNYSSSISVTVDGFTSAAIVLIDDSTLTFITPAHPSANNLDVAILTGGGQATLVGVFSYLAVPVLDAAPPVLPRVDSFSKRVGSRSQDTFHIFGLNFEGVKQLTLGGKPVRFIRGSATDIVFEAHDLPVGHLDLVLSGDFGSYTFLRAIEVMETVSIPSVLIGSRWSTVFEGNSRTLNENQYSKVRSSVAQFIDAKTLVCYGYTTSVNPNAWARTHSLARAEAMCAAAKALNPKLNVISRLRFGGLKAWAMRSSMQFWN